MRIGTKVDKFLSTTGYCHWVESVCFSDGVRMTLDTNEHQQKQLYWTGSYDSRGVEVLARHLPDQGVFVDVGAGVGSICLFVMSKCRAQGKQVEVYAFEPFTLNFERLTHNVAQNQLTETVHCQHLALAAEEDTMTLCSRNEVGAAAVLRSGDGVQDLAGSRIERVRCDSLDEWVTEQRLNRLDVLKVDIEGAEPLMFRGAMQSIRQFLPVILGEFNHWWAERHGLSIAADCFDPLWDLGYIPFRSASRRGAWEQVHGRPAPGPDMEDTLWVHPGRTPSS